MRRRHEARAVGEPLQTGPLDRVVFHDADRRVARMPGFLVRRVAPGVITADESPPVVWRAVLIAPMERVRVKEKGVARRHFDVDELHSLARSGDSFGIGARLLANIHVRQPAHLMRPHQYLHATDGPRRSNDSD